MLRHFLISIFSLWVAMVFAQQKPMFTNYILNEFYYNPAVAAAKEGADFRFLYRKQWAGMDGSPGTQTLTGHGRFEKLKLGIGGSFFHDKTGPLRNIGASLGVSYGIQFKNESILSAGINFGFMRYELGTDIKIREQDDIAVNAAQQGKFLPDLGIGIYYRWKGLYAGLAIPQMVQANIKLEVEDPLKMNKLIRHYFAAAGYRFTAAGKFELEPSFQIKGVKAAPVQADINLRGIYNRLAWLGVSYRTTDAVCIMAGVMIKDLIEVAYSYDITTSKLNTVSNGSHELMLNYRWKKRN
jgi:type IX secretion system PorP/SprF family membrane protein